MPTAVRSIHIRSEDTAAAQCSLMICADFLFENGRAFSYRQQSSTIDSRISYAYYHAYLSLPFLILRVLQVKRHTKLLDTLLLAVSYWTEGSLRDTRPDC